MGQIISGHCAEHSLGMIYVQYVPRIGEKLRVDVSASEIKGMDEHNGIYEVLDIVYEIPFNERQRIDAYLVKLSDLPKDLGFKSYYEAIQSNPIRGKIWEQILRSIRHHRYRLISKCER